MSNIIDFETQTPIDADLVEPMTPDVLLQQAIGRFKDVIILGIEEDGEMRALSNLLRVADMLLITEAFKFELLGVR